MLGMKLALALIIIGFAIGETTGNWFVGYLGGTLVIVFFIYYAVTDLFRRIANLGRGTTNVYNTQNNEIQFEKESRDPTRPWNPEEAAGFVNVNDRMRRLEGQYKTIEGKSRKP